jgi:hypothetical protein
MPARNFSLARRFSEAASFPQAMKRDSSTGDLDQDPVWDLLRQSPSRRPGPNFAADVVRAARLEKAAAPWWSRPWIPASIGATALAAVVLSLQAPSESAPPRGGTPAADASFADLQENYEAEVLLAASEHLADFSDEELVAMIGF